MSVFSNNMMLTRGVGNPTFMQMITTAGLTTNLKLCLDAGDIASWPGSGTKWLDTSGGGYDFYLGTNGSTSAPTFSGTPGAKTSNEYWSGADKFFTYSAANASWMNAMSQPGTSFTFMILAYMGTGARRSFFGTMGFPAGFDSIGILFGHRSSDTDGEFLENNGLAAGAGLVQNTFNSLWSVNTWYFTGLACTYGASGSGYYNEGSLGRTFNECPTGNSSSAATYTMQIGASGDNTQGMGSADRIACVAAWQGTRLTQANMDTLYTALKAARPGYGI